MVATWPSSLLPTNPLIDGFAQSYEASVWEFKPDVGRPLRGKRSSDSFRIWTGTYWFDEDQKEQFWTFFNDDINRGIDSFLMRDPDRDIQVLVELIDATPPEMTPVGPDTFQATLSFRILP